MHYFKTHNFYMLYTEITENRENQNINQKISEFNMLNFYMQAYNVRIN